jgi:outer membrane protein assembly factor BamA
MDHRLIKLLERAIIILLVGVAVLSVGCNVTKHIPEGQHLLWDNKIVLKSDKVMTNKGEIRDVLENLALQKPNTIPLDILPIKVPIRLIRYNNKYRKLHNRPDSLLPKNVERPVLIDTALTRRSTNYMRNYLFNQGYFYAEVRDTVIYKKKKAYVVYTVNAGTNYLINRIIYDIDDSAIARLMREETDASALLKGAEFTYSMLEEERSRVTSVARNNGYYRFTQENVTFKIDTLDKSFFKIAENPFENAVTFLSQVKSNKKPTLDINMVIRLADDSTAYKQYTISTVTVFPDYISAADQRDSTMIQEKIDGVLYKYHFDYVHSRALHQHIFVSPGKLYSQANVDKTYTKLNELGIFQYARIQFRENRSLKDALDCNIFLNRTKKYDILPSFELSTAGSAYPLGQTVGLSVRNNNLWKGANLFTIGASGGVEYSYNKDAENLIKRFDLQNRYLNLRGSIDFPKFLAPVATGLFTNTNLPHTIISGSQSYIHRVDLFTMHNSAANFTYSWRQSETKSWSFSPTFANIIKLPYRSDSFRKRLETNEYYKNSYSETFIEGENISFTFTDAQRKRGKNYTYLRLGFEEAGGLLSLVNDLGDVLNDYFGLQYAQYSKLDFDVQHFFTFPRSVVALRFYGGVGIPYGNTDVVPYIKQYFAGGPYSMRGFRLRTLGPGSFYKKDTTKIQIDRTGDIKLEMNGEYRFPVAPLFAGAIKLNGALFADVGNIWLARENEDFPGGEFHVSTLGQTTAANVGIGLRLDIVSFITVRLDFGMPVKKPYLANGGWVFNEINFKSSAWRGENLIPQFSIGYPF